MYPKACRCVVMGWKVSRPIINILQASRQAQGLTNRGMTFAFRRSVCKGLISNCERQCRDASTRVGKNKDSDPPMQELHFLLSFGIED